jgi:hypothetical protein
MSLLLWVNFALVVVLAAGATITGSACRAVLREIALAPVLRLQQARAMPCWITPRN